MSLYTVRFTTKRIVTRYGTRREVISEELTEVPITMKDLPLATAQGYSQCDNFSMEKQFAQVDAKTTYRKNSRNGRAWRDVDVGSAPAAKPKRNAKLDAAATGDMGAALNG